MTGAILLLLVPARVLTLADAVHTAESHQPALRQARAATDVARARADQLRAPLLPQITGLASYARRTFNVAPSPGVIMADPNAQVKTSFDTLNFFSMSLNASQVIWDGPMLERWHGANVSADAQRIAERTSLQNTVLAVRNAYFNVLAQKALLEVARENLANQERHLQQIKGFVEVGTRPEIDLAQASTDQANAEVQHITAENNFAGSKAQLNQAMGVEGPTDFDVADDTLPAVPGEDDSLEVLLDEAVKTRPELVTFAAQLHAASIAISAAKAAYGPSIATSMALTDTGTDPTRLVWNLTAGMTVSWQLFQGLLTWSQVREARANRVVLEAQRDLARQQIYVEVEQARLAVRAAKATIGSSEKALVNARTRLRLAEGRYKEGVGNAIELGDSQVAYTSAAAQRVQAAYNLAVARAGLLKALGSGTLSPS